ncbi:MAG: hypothetical protein K0S09_1897 [Sphingobacteriaceae bacterium]|jgi:hypothetical protein|nr:hypothetical protein [Sphingobacteriaceae bacterium]
MSQISLFTIIISALIAFFIVKSRGKSKWGVHLKGVRCPKCNEKQPFIRVPKNEREALWGGYTCNNCNTEMDKYGQLLDDKP